MYIHGVCDWECHRVSDGVGTYVPRSDLCCRISALFHDSNIAGHPSRWKTLELVSRNHWWLQMSRYIGKYVSTCDMCLHTKSIHQPLSGELYPLPILDTPWDTTSVDFIVELLESNEKDAIMVVVNSVTKWSHFVSSHHSVSCQYCATLPATLPPSYMEASWAP